MKGPVGIFINRHNCVNDVVIEARYYNQHLAYFVEFSVADFIQADVVLISGMNKKI